MTGLDDLLAQYPVIGDHPALELNWSAEQLQPVVDRLRPHLPARVSQDMLLAAAGIVSSIVFEHMATGGGVRYSRSHDYYQEQKHSRSHPRLYTHHFVTTAVDILAAAGLIVTKMGLWGRPRGFQSVAWATARLLDVAGPEVDLDGPAGPASEPEVIVLRDRADKRTIDYTDTPSIEAQRRELQTLNRQLAKVELYHGRYKFDIPLLRRIFNGDFSRGGRLYCAGDSWQNMPKAARSQLTIEVNGVPQSVVEVDYSNLHITMAYAESGRKMPDGDQYAIAGFPRKLVKLVVNTLFNAATHNSAVLAISDELYKNSELRRGCGVPRHRGHCRKVAEAVVRAVRAKHHKISDYFGSDCGARFQRKDSILTLGIMARVLKRTGRCPLPLHDSLIVAKCDAKVLTDTMTEVAIQHHLTNTHPTTNQTTKDPTPHTPQSQLFHLEDTASDLVLSGEKMRSNYSWGEGFWRENGTACNGPPRPNASRRHEAWAVTRRNRSTVGGGQ